MTNTFGKNILADADGIIGLAYENDALHQKCLKIFEFAERNSFSLIVTYTTVLEAATVLAKAKTIKRPDLAKQILKDYSAVDTLPQLDLEVGSIVAEMYDPQTSIKNSPFDYYLLAVAKKNNIGYVFSFDSFYKKHGLILAEELLRR